MKHVHNGRTVSKRVQSGGWALAKGHRWPVSLSTQHRAILAAPLRHTLCLQCRAVGHPLARPISPRGARGFGASLRVQKGPHTRRVFARADYIRLKND